MWRVLFLVMLLCSAPGLPPGATPGAVLVPRSEGVRLYREPNAAAAVLQTLTRDHRLLEFHRRDDWVEVAVFRVVGLRGWVRSGAVMRERRVPDPPPPKPSRPKAPSEGDPIYLFELAVAGTPAIGFRGTCRVVAGDDSEESFNLSGLVPHRATAEARAISCTLRKTDAFGRLAVTLLRDGAPLAAARTRAAFNWVRVRSAGPWGSAAGLRGTVGLVLPKPPARGADSKSPPPRRPVLRSP